MSAHSASSVVKEEAACHIYNESPKGKKVFDDTEDYATFLAFLNEYLLPPAPEKRKKEFTVNGRTYKGVPHQPKNYAKTIKLLAYSLTPTRFDFLVKYSDKTTLQKFMRSLSTRYSIYFHKKYPGNGKVFKDSYKSKDIKDDRTLLNLTREFHKNSLSSYQEYLGTRATEWVNASSVLDIFKTLIGGEYKKFVENIESIGVEENVKEAKKEIAPEVPETKDQNTKTHEYVTVTTGPGFREVFAAGSVFLVLLTFGLKNVRTHAYASNVQPKTYVLSEATEEPPVATPEPTPVEISQEDVAVVSVASGSAVDILEEATTSAKVVAETESGEVFKILSSTKDWYEIQVNEKETGFIQSKYVEVYQNE